MTQKTNQNPWTMDVRVRERNLKSGALTDKDLEKHLAALPDVGDQAESFGTSQPALVQQHVAPVVSESVVDDEPEDEEDEDEEETNHEANGAGAVDSGETGGDLGGGSEGDQP